MKNKFKRTKLRMKRPMLKTKSLKLKMRNSLKHKRKFHGVFPNSNMQSQKDTKATGIILKTHLITNFGRRKPILEFKTTEKQKEFKYQLKKAQNLLTREPKHRKMLKRQNLRLKRK